MSKFVISLDFEMFWGVADSRTLANYGQNVVGEWIAIPKILKLFSQYGINATWATVGMLMCRNHAQWRDIRPEILPSYMRPQCSTYNLDSIVREYPELFFARPLVQQIMDTHGQELASHTYSHFYCGENGATPAQFAADLVCARYMAAESGLKFRSIVFPRNQLVPSFLDVLPTVGIKAYRGNPDHILYRYGHFTPGGLAGRLARFADAWLPISGAHLATIENCERTGLTNIPASMFLRPFSRARAAFEHVRLARIKSQMTLAAKNGGVFHLWWHPHNFGVCVEENLAVLDSLLRHFRILQERYGMRSVNMDSFIPTETK